LPLTWHPDAYFSNDATPLRFGTPDNRRTTAQAAFAADPTQRRQDGLVLGKRALRLTAKIKCPKFLPV
jgi:hypothetical protein